jgi:hypothetical protein
MKHPLFPMVMILLVLALPSPGAAYGENSRIKPEQAIPDTSHLLIPLPYFSKMGFQTGFVNSKDMDTGVDFGALLSKGLYRDFLEVTTTFHLWGATNDTLDVATAAIDGDLVYKIPLRWGMYGFAGLSMTYGYVSSEKTIVRNGVPSTSSTGETQFQTFITLGAEYDLHENRTLFVRIKYGETELSRELHVLGGINFYTKYKKFIPWLAPPLMRD